MLTYKQNPVKVATPYTWGGRLQAAQQRDMVAGNPVKVATPYTWGGRLQAAQQRDMIAGNPIKAVTPYTWTGAGERSVQAAIAKNAAKYPSKTV
mmetsp:Transcript_49941/g.108505  ORF Transcript_49941/g.108505 Transcript_49941/m.108505 type:complete len:94 (-) Transcript_49941:34-315(-)